MDDTLQTHYETFDFPDFAQEFLRRNPAYQRQYQQMNQAGESTTEQLSSSEVAHVWGLEFLDRART